MRASFRRSFAIGVALAVHAALLLVFNIDGQTFRNLVREAETPLIAIQVIRAADIDPDARQSGAREAANAANARGGPSASAAPEASQPAKTAILPRFRNVEIDRQSPVEPLPSTPEFRAWAERPLPGASGATQSEGDGEKGGGEATGDAFAAVKLFECLTQARQGKRGLECVTQGGRLFTGAPLGDFRPDFARPKFEKPDCKLEVCDDEKNFDKPITGLPYEVLGPHAPETRGAETKRLDKGARP